MPQIDPAGQVPDPLDAAFIRDRLGARRLGREIVVLEEVRSTNDHLLQLAGPQVAEGVVVMAEHQTAGRGQHGRRWESARGEGIYLSVLLRPGIPVEESSRLTAWAAQAVARVVGHFLRRSPVVKPPNDVHIDGAKIAGVLVEMRAQGRSYLAILGIGLNVNQRAFPEDLGQSATSLRKAAGCVFDRNEVTAELLAELDRTYPAVRAGM